MQFYIHSSIHLNGVMLKNSGNFVSCMFSHSTTYDVLVHHTFQMVRGRVLEYLSLFQIFVNGSLAHRVCSPSLNKAILQRPDFSYKVEITMYVLTPQGHCSEPASIIFQEPENKNDIRNMKYD